MTTSKKDKLKPTTIAELSAMGGKARWRKVTKADRQWTMRQVALARWDKIKKDQRSTM